jgi:hypothetical protein
LVGARRVPMNIRCSNKCAKPVRPARSMREPTPYDTFIAICGTEWSSLKMTTIPFDSVVFAKGIWMSWAAADQASVIDTAAEANQREMGDRRMG